MGSRPGLLFHDDGPHHLAVGAPTVLTTHATGSEPVRGSRDGVAEPNPDRGKIDATPAHLSAYTWARVIGWLRRKHRRITWQQLRRRYCGGGWWPAPPNGCCSTRPRCAPRAADAGAQ
jgi:hypothetical protein